MPFDAFAGLKKSSVGDAAETEVDRRPFCQSSDFGLKVLGWRTFVSQNQV
jgi:hypothetical protein